MLPSWRSAPAQFGHRMCCKPEVIAPSVARLGGTDHQWPGDVREAARALIAMHKRALAASPADEYQPSRLEPLIRGLESFAR